MVKHTEERELSGVFLLCEGLPPTILESQVLTHVRAMREVGVNMEVWALALTKSIYDHGCNALPRLLQDYGVRIRLFRGVKPALPFSRQLNALLLLGWLLRKKCRPRFIHARTEYSTAVAATIKHLMKFKLIWDARGDTLSEFEDTVSRMRPPYRWLAPIKRRAIREHLAIAAKESDRAIFVSEALQDLQGSQLDPAKTLVVPCLADERLFHYDPVLRIKVRARLGYNEKQIVIMYSGSTAHWQCVPETIELMRQAIELDSRCRALVVTAQPDTFERLIPKHLRERFTVTSCTLREMNGFLNAADIGVMLREKNSINWVASPVKFAEYSLTGLRVVTTDTVQQAVAFGESIGNLINPKFIPGVLLHIRHLDADRRNRAEVAATLLGRHGSRKNVAALYSVPLQVVEFLKFY